MRTLLLLALAVACVGFAPAPLPKPSKNPDMAGMTGNWVMTRYISGTTDHLRTQKLRIVIDKDSLAFFVQEPGRPERPSSKYQMKVDRDAKPAKFSWSNGPGNPTQYVGTYKADKDTLSILFAQARGDDTRPTDFDNVGPQEYLMVMRRQPVETP